MKKVKQEPWWKKFLIPAIITVFVVPAGIFTRDYFGAVLAAPKENAENRKETAENRKEITSVKEAVVQQANTQEILKEIVVEQKQKNELQDEELKTQRTVTQLQVDSLKELLKEIRKK